MSLLSKDSCVRVSSVLNKNSREYGKHFMIDNCDDTCWNSAQGSPQWIEVTFPQCSVIKELHIQFQGGFAGKETLVEIKEGNEMKKLQSLYPEDNNSLQIFPLEEKITDSIRIVFNSSTDFFGRIIVYKLEIIGNISMK